MYVHIYFRIAEMCEHKYTFTWDQLQNKWKGLARTYKSIRDHNNESGRNRQSWMFYAEIDRLLSKSPAVDPPIAVHNGKRIISGTLLRPDSASPTISEGSSITSDSSEVMDTPRSAKRCKKDMDTNEILLMAIEESKRQHEEDLEEKRKFNRVLENLVDTLSKNK